MSALMCIQALHGGYRNLPDSLNFVPMQVLCDAPSIIFNYYSLLFLSFFDMVGSFFAISFTTCSVTISACMHSLNRYLLAVETDGLLSAKKVGIKEGGKRRRVNLYYQGSPKMVLSCTRTPVNVCTAHCKMTRNKQACVQSMLKYASIGLERVLVCTGRYTLLSTLQEGLEVERRRAE